MICTLWSRGQAYIPEDQRPLLWKTFGGICAWVKEFHSNNYGDVHFPVHFQLLENSLCPVVPSSENLKPQDSLLHNTTLTSSNMLKNFNMVEEIKVKLWNSLTQAKLSPKVFHSRGLWSSGMLGLTPDPWRWTTWEIAYAAYTINASWWWIVSLFETRRG